jgi:hypothetical protein
MPSVHRVPTRRCFRKGPRTSKPSLCFQVRVYDAAEKKLLELSPTEQRFETIKIDQIVRLAETNVVGFSLRNAETRRWQRPTSTPTSLTRSHLKIDLRGICVLSASA